ncbi:MAG: DUF488 domain-containing protein [Armatimonadota bacterium]|nr:DUF488 domain-containing protein [Armatimonadota bacterium]MDR7484973.1 DUF488 domain-containing protein [Armatimonadota bacterium]MDR7533676.1 DUF488 domain-containing protein [Armatimonadota bacterium]MDR7535487.1 DUF488 domain-containing protein [Armatimonadota bacterium]
MTSGGDHPGARSAPVVFTLGTSTRTSEEFVACCRAFGITRVVDVRRFPTSHKYPQFVREAFATFLRDAQIDYAHLGPTLGGYRTGGYETYMATAAFREGLAELERLARAAPTAVVCSERLPWRCHRRFIARALEARGWRVVHVIEPDPVWTPEPAATPFNGSAP